MHTQGSWDLVAAEEDSQMGLAWGRRGMREMVTQALQLGSWVSSSFGSSPRPRNILAEGCRHRARNGALLLWKRGTGTSNVMCDDAAGAVLHGTLPCCALPLPDVVAPHIWPCMSLTSPLCCLSWLFACVPPVPCVACLGFARPSPAPCVAHLALHVPHQPLALHVLALHGPHQLLKLGLVKVQVL